MNYGGILQPLLESVEQSVPSGTARLAGQEVITERNDVKVFLAVDGDQNVHFLLSPAPSDDHRFSRFQLAALTIQRQSWAVGGAPVQPYLDLMCARGTDRAFRRPFLSLCEDLLLDMDRGGVRPEDAAYRTCARWQRFWTADDDALPSIEWIRGLIGELLFLERLSVTLGAAAVNAWTGPEGRDHDFQALTRIAFEVKVSSVVPYLVECNLNQLDETLFDELYLVCYFATRAAEGETITGVVSRIENLFLEDDATTETFLARLAQTGYRRQKRADYEAIRLQVQGPAFFRVDAAFPKITTASFRAPLDARVRGVRYNLQLVGVESLPADSPAIASAIAKLGA